MNSEQLKSLQINPEFRKRPQRSLWMIFIVVVTLTGVTVYFAWPRSEDSRRVVDTTKNKEANAALSAVEKQQVTPKKPAGDGADTALLTVSGYIVNRERIELSPRFLGVVKWIGVKKGDAVTNGQVVVLLDDAEYKARLLESQGRLANTKAAVEKAALTYGRVAKLATDKVESKQIEDEARLNLEAARATQKEVEGQVELIKTYVDWTVIRSPINGVVLEKLVDPNELVVPQSFGGTRGPSTALIALADPKDLQVETDLNESDLAKVFLNQKCRVSPEAYPDKVYDGYVAEMAPEANRQKGTLQIKVQIQNPDRYLTPELSARVDFLGR
ncbi:MAG: efflux RND transporter periplasmic adaptor subunit [Verrucomicrobiota bacterium]